ncbi:MAG: flagellar biosynthesis anti-sigma factor FlgM, partial [Pseudomonadales bacterium]|nr:flagellar biosynthesis anti-sigma factor FlgM [Pseudomonadales bacterium]
NSANSTGSVSSGRAPASSPQPPQIATPAGPPATATPMGQVVISAEAMAMQKLAQQLRNGPVDSGKVAHLRQSIANNTYTINPDSIAQKLLQNEEDLHR